MRVLKVVSFDDTASSRGDKLWRTHTGFRLSLGIADKENWSSKLSDSSMGSGFIPPNTKSDACE